MEQKDVMTIEMTAEYLNLTIDEVKSLVDDREIPCTKIVGKLLFVRQQILEWVAHNVIKEPSKWDDLDDDTD